METRIIEHNTEVNNRILLTEHESKDYIRRAGITVNETKLATSENEAISLSKTIGYPIVLKISSKDISHKSDANGVKLNLQTEKEVRDAYKDIMLSAHQRFPTAEIEGVTVQKLVPTGVEVTIGMFKDPQFGPVLMFGLGGIWIEVLKDVAFRIVPLRKKDAYSIIREIKGLPLLEGVRGTNPVKIKSLEEALLNLSSFILENPELAEFDLNPIFAYSDGYISVDARVIIEKNF